MNRNVDILVRLLVVGHPANGNLITPGPDVDDDTEEPPFTPVLVRRFDRNPATDNVVSKLFELFCLFEYGRFNEVGMLQVLEANL